MTLPLDQIRRGSGNIKHVAVLLLLSLLMSAALGVHTVLFGTAYEELYARLNEAALSVSLADASVADWQSAVID